MAKIVYKDRLLPKGQKIVVAKLNLKQAVSFLESTVQENHAVVSMTPAEGLERMLNRGKVDIMSILPEEDVANMSDVTEVMNNLQ